MDDSSGSISDESTDMDFIEEIDQIMEVDDYMHLDDQVDVTSNSSDDELVQEIDTNGTLVSRNIGYITRSVQRDQRNVILEDHSQLAIPNRRPSNLLSSSDEYISDGSEHSESEWSEDEFVPDNIPYLNTEEIHPPTESGINQHLRESVIIQQSTGSVIAQQPTRSGVAQQPVISIESGITLRPTGSGIVQQPMIGIESGITLQPTGSAIAQQATESGITQQQPIVSEIILLPSGSPIANQPMISSTPERPTNSANIQDYQQEADEVFSCPICLEGLTSSGDHRPACLKCGHIFGDNCIKKWIKVGIDSNARRCPTCNTKACLKDIRILYAKNLIAIDTAELTALQTKLEIGNRENNILKSEIENYVVKHELLKADMQKLTSLVEELKKSGTSSTSPSSTRTCLKLINISKKQGCRVMAFNKNNMLLAVSQSTDSPLFSKSHVIRKVNASILELSKECIYAHKKQIRDMVFHPVEHNLLASVGLDKCINLSDVISNMVVSSVEVEEPLWSCCWAGDNSNVLIAGGQAGSLYYVDRRFMKLLYATRKRTPACVSLVPIPPSNSRAFIRGGFLKAQMNALSVFEHQSGEEDSLYKETELSLKGLWSSTCYDSQSNLLLSTAKPCGDQKSIRHIVSKIVDYKDLTDEVLIQPVTTFFGGDKATLLSRSCLVPSNKFDEDTLVCSYDEKSNAVKLFSVNSMNNIHNFYVKEPVLDVCSLNGVIMNGRRTIASLSENNLCIFSV